VAEKECWEMVQFNRCVNNVMEGSVDSFSFTASPEGDGAWMQAKEYSVINCKTACLVFNRYKNRPFRNVQTVRKKDGFYPSYLNAKKLKGFV
jgi:hypothetical protein